jgi:hydrogenase expression/formation protein HypD
MKYVDEFRAPDLISKAGEEIRKLADPSALPDHGSLRRAHACHLSFRAERFAPFQYRTGAWPGCPVCVLPMGRIDDGLSMCLQPDFIFTAFGDMMRVPGTNGSTFGI